MYDVSRETIDTVDEIYNQLVVTNGLITQIFAIGIAILFVFLIYKIFDYLTLRV